MLIQDVDSQGGRGDFTLSSKIGKIVSSSSKVSGEHGIEDHLNTKDMEYNQSLQDMQSFRDGWDCPKSSVSAVQSRFAARTI